MEISEAFSEVQIAGIVVLATITFTDVAPKVDSYGGKGAAHHCQGNVHRKICSVIFHLFLQSYEVVPTQDECIV